MEPSQIQEQLNEAMRYKLESNECIAGKLECRLTPAFLLTFRGEKENGKSIFFWEPDRKINKLLDQYQTTVAPEAAAITIDIDLLKDSFVYEITSQQQASAQKKEEARQQEAEEAARLKKLKESLLACNTPYGHPLANKVADALQHGRLMYGHRDYCGMGLEKDRDGNYVYGPVWDGGLEPASRFDSREAFVQWLAAQSDASLSRVNETDPWVWNNQVINQQRLEEFVSWHQSSQH